MKFPRVPRECVEVATDAGEFVILRYVIITTPFVEYRCYERCEERAGYTHSTYTFEEGFGKLGLVSARALPPELDELPFGEERAAAVDRWRHVIAAQCIAAIREAFPDVMERKGARVDGANISTAETEPAEAVA